MSFTFTAAAAGAPALDLAANASTYHYITKNSGTCWTLTGMTNHNLIKNYAIMQRNRGNTFEQGPCSPW